MKTVTFNRNPLTGGSLAIVEPEADEVRATPQLFRASLEDALRFGGDLTREAIGAMKFVGDRDHFVVDTKVHMLMPGMSPAIPGWHTDGVPRGVAGDPSGRGDPNILAQEEIEDHPRYHLLVTGEGSLTEFVHEAVELRVPDEPDPDLYTLLTNQMEALLSTVCPICDGESHYTTEAGGTTPCPRCGGTGKKEPEVKTGRIPSGMSLMWDWWDLHTARPAEKHEWRFLIRVAETNFLQPNEDLRDIIRTQTQVYVPSNFGW